MADASKAALQAAFDYIAPNYPHGARVVLPPGESYVSGGLV